MKTMFYANEVIGYGVGKPSPLPTRVASDIISPIIPIVELEFLRPVLGKKMYNDMIDKMNAVPSNYNPSAGALVQKFPNDANYEILFVDYVQMYMGNAFYFRYIPHSKVQITNNGAQNSIIENAEPSSVKDLEMLQNSQRLNVETLQKALVEFLCENKTDYPLFDDCRCGCNKTNSNNKTPIFSGIGGKIDY